MTEKWKMRSLQERNRIFVASCLVNRCGGSILGSHSSRRGGPHHPTRGAPASRWHRDPLSGYAFSCLTHCQNWMRARWRKNEKKSPRSVCEELYLNFTKVWHTCGRKNKETVNPYIMHVQGKELKAPWLSKWLVLIDFLNYFFYCFFRKCKAMRGRWWNVFILQALSLGAWACLITAVPRPRTDTEQGDKLFKPATVWANSGKTCRPCVAAAREEHLCAERFISIALYIYQNVKCHWNDGWTGPVWPRKMIDDTSCTRLDLLMFLDPFSF